ncbi:hypothetical protein BJY59DRAFT_701230 [Rhodotorula toruloides]
MAWIRKGARWRRRCDSVRRASMTNVRRERARNHMHKKRRRREVRATPPQCSSTSCSESALPDRRVRTPRSTEPARPPAYPPKVGTLDVLCVRERRRRCLGGPARLAMLPELACIAKGELSAANEADDGPRPDGVGGADEMAASETPWALRARSILPRRSDRTMRSFGET